MAAALVGQTIAIAVALLVLGGCSLAEPVARDDWRPRLVLLYVPCTVNKGYLAPYGPGVPYTPHLARFGEEAVVFERHQTEAGQSAIAYASIASGGQADHHGIYSIGRRAPNPVPLLHEEYTRNGWDAFVWSGHPAMYLLGRGLGADRRHRRALVSDDPVFLQILDRLRADPSYRVFIFASTMTTHGPYKAARLGDFRAEFPDESASQADSERFVPLYWKDNFALSWNHVEAVGRLGLESEEVSRLASTVETLYKSNVHELDRTFGALQAAIESRGLFDQSLIVFTADHGEVMYRENAPFQWSHSNQLAPEVLNVPLILRSPAVSAGRYHSVTRSMDLLPTLLSLSGIAPPAGPGTDLSPALLGRVEPPRQVAASHTTVLPLSVFEQMYTEEHARDWGRVRELFPEVNPELMWVSLRDGDLVFKHQRLGDTGWTLQVFDLATDPAETRDLYDESDTTHRAMAAQLQAYKRRLIAGYEGRVLRAPSTAPSPHPEEVEMMKDLGYIR